MTIHHQPGAAGDRADAGGSQRDAGAQSARRRDAGCCNRPMTAPGPRRGTVPYLLDYTKTGALSDEAIERLRAEMSEEEFQQELCVQLQRAELGQLLRQADAGGRGGRPHHQRAATTRHCRCGPRGISASTMRRPSGSRRSPVAGECGFIDYIEDSGAALDHYVGSAAGAALSDYEMHLLPHDAAVKELGSGRRRTETLASMGLFPYRVSCASTASRTVSMRCAWCCRGRGSMPRSASAASRRCATIGGSGMRRRDLARQPGARLGLARRRQCPLMPSACVDPAAEGRDRPRRFLGARVAQPSQGRSGCGVAGGMSGSRNALLGGDTSWYQSPSDVTANPLLRQAPIAPPTNWASQRRGQQGGRAGLAGQAAADQR